MVGKSTNSDTCGSQRVTQFCPNCGYDLCGLPEDRCPECGQRFDRSTLPIVEEGSAQPERSLWPLQAAAIGLAFVHYGLGSSAANTVFQLAWLGLMWLLAAAWVILRWGELSRPGRAPGLLWLLIPCMGTPTRPYLPERLELGAAVFALAVGTAVLMISLWSSARRTAGYLTRAAGVVLLTVGALSIIVGLMGALVGADPDRTKFSVFAWEYPGTRQNHLIVAIIGAVVVLAGYAIVRWGKGLLAK